MKIKRLVLRAALAAVLLVSLAGCSGYATLVRSDGGNAALSIQALEKTWHGYTVYYTRTGGPRYGNVAILFDPKEDNKIVIARHWDKIEDQQTLTDIIAALKGHRPNLYLVKASNGVLYAYLYAAKQWLIAKAVNDTTLHVYDFPPRPIGPGF